jgi:hypothetical protein
MTLIFKRLRIVCIGEAPGNWLAHLLSINVTAEFLGPTYCIIVPVKLCSHLFEDKGKALRYSASIFND